MLPLRRPILHRWHRKQWPVMLLLNLMKSLFWLFDFLLQFILTLDFLFGLFGFGLLLGFLFWLVNERGTLFLEDFWGFWRSLFLWFFTLLVEWALVVLLGTLWWGLRVLAWGPLYVLIGTFLELLLAQVRPQIKPFVSVWFRFHLIVLLGFFQQLHSLMVFLLALRMLSLFTLVMGISRLMVLVLLLLV